MCPPWASDQLAAHLLAPRPSAAAAAWPPATATAPPLPAAHPAPLQAAPPAAKHPARPTASPFSCPRPSPVRLAIPCMHSILAAAALAALGAAIHVRAGPAAPAGSNASTTLADAVGPAVNASLTSARLALSGWSWNLPSTTVSQSRRRSGDTSAEAWAKSNLNLYSARVAANPDNLLFAPDPSAASSSAPGPSASQVLSITYAAGSYSLQADPPGGAALYAQPFLNATGGMSGSNTPYVAASQTADHANASSPSRAQLLLAYSVFFPDDFDFVQGGKLPGLYSSVGSLLNNTGVVDANTDACQGGSLNGVGSSCWSSRIMWRQAGQGEVYMRIPQSLGGGYKLCPADRTTATGASIICDDDYGLSVGRGSFTFRKGSWNDLALYVQINSPGVANGRVHLFVNGAATPAIQLDGIVFRSQTVNPDSIPNPDSGVYTSAINGKPPTSGLNRRDVYDADNQTWVDKVAWESFFGANTSYATPNNTQTYYKNIAVSWPSFSTGMMLLTRDA